MASLFSTSRRTKTSTLSLRLLYEKPIVQVSTAVLLTIFTSTFLIVSAIRPTLTTIGQLLRTIDDKKQVKQQLDQKVAALATAQAAYVSAEPYLPYLTAAMPPDHQFDRLAKLIEGAASSLGMGIEAIDFLDVEVPPAPLSMGGGILELPVTVRVTGSYAQLTQLLDLLTKLERVALGRGVRFSSESTTSGSGIDMAVELTAYYLPVGEL